MRRIDRGKQVGFLMAEVRRQRNVTIVELDAEYDALNTVRLDDTRAMLLATVQEAEPPLVVLDLSRTRYMGSAFIEAVFRAWKRARSREGRLVLCGVQPFCAEVLKATRLDTMLESFADLPQAIAALQGD